MDPGFAKVGGLRRAHIASLIYSWGTGAEPPEVPVGRWEPPDPQPGASPKAESFLSIFVQSTGQKLRKCARRTVLSMTTVLRGHFHFHLDFLLCEDDTALKTAQQIHEKRHLHSSQNV